MAKSPKAAYRKGYADGLRMARRIRWQGTLVGILLRGARYQPDRDYRAEYDKGFRQAMEDTSVVEWTPPRIT